MKFAPLIRAARRREGMTQQDLAVAAKVARNAVWLVEQGSGTLATLLPILAVLQIAIAGLSPGRDLGSRLQAARQKRRWSLQELSTQSGLSIPTLCGLEQNQGRVASLEAVIRALAPTARERKPRKQRTFRSTPALDSAFVQSFITGNCIEVMPGIKEGSIDLVVTSPPYNAEKVYEDRLSLAEYTSFAECWLSCIPPILSDTGALWLNVGYMKTSESTTLPLTYLYYSLAQKFGLRLMQEIVWHYEGGMTYSRRFAHRTERWMWFVKDPTNYEFHLDEVRDGTLNRTADGRNHEFGKNPTDYWYFDRVVGGRGATKDKTAHPAQMPVEMVERIVRACSNPGAVVLDPFGGSGSTAVAASRNGRGFISIERNPVYVEIARRRVERGE